MNINKTKVGILTLHFSNNYGAMYQVYALSRYVESIGGEVSVINYHMDKPTIKTFMFNLHLLVRKIIERKAFSLSFFKNRNQVLNSYAEENKMNEVFNQFRNQNLNITSEIYSYESLKKTNFDYGSIIVGSDQVWAADFVFSSPAYLLAFAGRDINKIAYAPSFGKKKLEGYLKGIFRKHSKNITHMSARETSGVKLVKELTGRDIPKVVDPTLLLDSYDEIISDDLVPSDKYLLCYRLDQEADLTKWFNDAVEVLANKLGLKVIYISPNSRQKFSPWEVLEPSPGELLGLIKNSHLVITNSFHGTVFSLILNAQFLSFARDGYPDKQNLRMIELLDSVNLSKHFINPFASKDEILVSQADSIDWKSVDKLLDSERNRSKDFLREALNLGFCSDT